MRIMLMLILLAGCGGQAADADPSCSIDDAATPATVVTTCGGDQFFLERCGVPTKFPNTFECNAPKGDAPDRANVTWCCK